MMGMTFKEFEEIRRAATESAAKVAAIQFVLVEKGIVTLEELNVIEARCRAALDQLVAGMRDAARDFSVAEPRPFIVGSIE